MLYNFYTLINARGQIVEEDGTVDTFIVTGCDLHEVSTKKPLSDFKTLLSLLSLIKISIISPTELVF